jgi:hypothetical protein
MNAAPIAVDSYEQLLQTLRDRMAALDTSFEQVESVSGIGDRYLNRVLGPHPTKGIGPVTFSIFAALGLRLVLVEDPQLLGRVRDRLRRRFLRNGPHDSWVRRQQNSGAL